MTLWRTGLRVEGTLHLTSHHLIFSYVPPPQPGQAPDAPTRPRELWITYPMIAFCTYRPTHPTSRQQPSIRIRCRDFTFVSFHFLAEEKARDVYDTIRNLTAKIGRLEKLYAFSYQAQGPEKNVNGWQAYDPIKEWTRQGINSKNANKGWRITKINENYDVCLSKHTFPQVMADR